MINVKYRDFDELIRLYEDISFDHKNKVKGTKYPSISRCLLLLLKYVYIESDLVITKVLLEYYRLKKNKGIREIFPHFKKTPKIWSLLPLEDNMIQELYCISQIRNILIQHESSNLSKMYSCRLQNISDIWLCPSSLPYQNEIENNTSKKPLIKSFKNDIAGLCTKYNVKYPDDIKIYMTTLFYTIPRSEVSDRRVLHDIVSQIGCVKSRSYLEVVNTMKVFIKIINKENTNTKV